VKKLELFVSCSQGVEPLLSDELAQMGYDDCTQGFRGVYVPNTSMEAIYRINYCSRLGSRVLLPLSSFRCQGRNDLYDAAARIDWTQYIRPGKTFAIDANVSHPELRNSLFAAQVVKDAVCDRFREGTGNRPSVNVKNPDVQLNLFIYNGRGVLSFDTSGVPLYKRGYRLESVEAPLQESLAAAMLTLAEYSKDDVLLDPCCGSGTFLIEAALMVSRTAPGYLRNKWGFMDLPEYEQTDWLKVKNLADAGRVPLVAGKLFGCDVNRDAVRIAKTNLRAAGFLKEVSIVQADFREFEPAVPPSMVMTNPPHGKRLSEEDQLIPVYRALGDFLKKKTMKPSKGYVFCGSGVLAKEVGLATKQRHVFNSGGIESRLLEYELY
jgi:putative N6-adenine-specific DNA methylase